MFLVLFCLNSAHISSIQLVCDGLTDWWTDGTTDERTHPLVERQKRI